MAQRKIKRRAIRFVSREQAVRELRARLERGSFPRLQMLLLVLLTGGAGLLTSFVLLALGLHAMGLRYLLACCIAYLCFLTLLGIWIRWRRGDQDSVLDAADWVDGSSGSSSASGQGWQGGGGRFGGGGASGDWEEPAAQSSSSLFSSASPTSSRSGTNGSWTDGLDGDDILAPLLLVGIVASVLLSAFYFVWSAPVLFAELLLDGMLAAGLYRRLRHIDARHWLETAVRKTWAPFAIATVLLTGAGFGLQKLVPQADSLGDAVRHSQPRAR